ncbi:hypothetical protein HN018_28000 (plasmid) [Lichenicola cladoniae]|uniref:Uncharacterized protein n=1 Tax=Lichenicola cladoniae TaxID=1484109 RepID=A0A6M8I135_9PROT|nr:hypothetical protein [Lichenicola cladoniae]NPD69658.1 hypothetical protein [Acetobacteraceae bacterium]QKE93967.1 hypothetical protein HN018_28000 [Lichenicola cladoniae]
MPTEHGLALVDPGVTAQLEWLLDEVLVVQMKMMSAIDAVCAQASGIIGRLTDHAASGAASLVATTAAGPAGPDRPPTPAMKAYVDSLAKQNGVKPPGGYTSSSAICPAFLDRHAFSKQAHSKEATSAANPTRSCTGLQAARGSWRVPKENYQGKAIDKNKAVSRSSSAPAATSADGPTETALRISYSNKEVALKLGPPTTAMAVGMDLPVSISQHSDKRAGSDFHITSRKSPNNLDE